jgi:hypothetical protein
VQTSGCLSPTDSDLNAWHALLPNIADGEEGEEGDNGEYEQEYEVEEYEEEGLSADEQDWGQMQKHTEEDMEEEVDTGTAGAGGVRVRLPQL